MKDDFNLAEIYLTPNEKNYTWQFVDTKSLPIDEEEQDIFGADFRIEHQIIGEKKVIYMKWAETAPQKDIFKDDGIIKLNSELSKLKDKSNVLVCLFDGALPDWIVDNGGWLNNSTIDYFLQYIEYVLRNLGGKVSDFLLSDQLNLAFYNDYLTKSNGIVDKKSLEQVIANFVVCQIKSYHKIHEINLNYDVDSFVGQSFHLRMFDTTKLLTKLKESEQENLLQEQMFLALSSGYLAHNSEKYAFGEQRFFDFFAIRTLSLSDNVSKLINGKNLCENGNFVKCKTLFCKMLVKYFGLEDCPIYILK